MNDNKITQEQAKQFARFIYRDVITAIAAKKSVEETNDKPKEGEHDGIAN